ncbi:hypothetical protein U0355_05810 [Salimicrobium sp. PL1-032A]|uniref:hypothetical protein n=1 Tax=Salimicrobium sp. PL1-032A TaxID=3095364 RepID=UPI0032603CD3
MGSLIGFIIGVVIVTMLLFTIDLKFTIMNRIILLLSAAAVAGFTLLAFVTFSALIALSFAVIMIVAVYTLVLRHVITMKNPEEEKDVPVEKSIGKEKETLPVEENESPSYLLETRKEDEESAEESERKVATLRYEKETDPVIEAADLEEELLAARGKKRQGNGSFSAEEEEGNGDRRHIEDAFELEDIKPVNDREVDR